MPDDILSSDELDALLASVDDESATGANRKKRVVEYDFIRPNKLSGDQARSLQHMHETIAQNLTMSFSTYLRVSLEVELISIGQLTFSVFCNSLSNPTVINVLDMDPLEDQALITMDMKLAFSIIDKMLGGEGKSIDKIRNLTSVEENLIDNVMKRFISRVQDGWEPLIPFDAKITSREMDPQFVQVIPSSEMVMVVTFSVSSPGELETGEMCLCIPFISLDQTLSKLNNSFQFSNTQKSQTDVQESYINKVVNETTLPVRVELGTTVQTIGEIISLKEDDILVLDQRQDQGLKIFVEDNLRMTGKAGKIGKKTGVIIEKIIPDGNFLGKEVQNG